MKKRRSIFLTTLFMFFWLFSMNIEVLADTAGNAASITLNKASVVLTVGETDTLTATLPSNSANQNVTWLTTNPNVVKIFNGVLMALSPGTAFITATTADGQYATCIVIVKNPDSSITLNKTTDVLSVGTVDTLTATVTPNQAVTWTSSDSKIVQVFNGVIMAQSIGTAVITATAADGSCSATCTVTVNTSGATMTLSKSSDTLKIGGTDTLYATVSPQLPTNTYIMWISSNPSIASVSGGVVSGLNLGSTVITAIASDGSCSAACNVTVADGTVNTTRLGGSDRFETSVAISKSGWENGSTYAVLATGNDYPDALSAAPLAKKYNAPILLTDTKTIPQVTLDEIKRLNTTYIFICGGTGAVSQEIENQLNSMGITTERLMGADRYATSVAIANKLGNGSGKLMVANGYDWSDALSVSSIAAKEGIPIILTDKDNLPDSLQSFIGNTNFSKAYVLGDTDLISNAIASKFPNSERIVGSNKYERNINIIKTFQGELDSTSICIATGSDFPDALSGSALAATLSSAIVLVDNNNLQDVTTQYTTQALVTAKNIYVFGLQGAVSDATISKLVTK
ncbi:cell wall-binding repeat-containing protein [Desulfitobacterium sp. AusDCA]|uniref:cell wall-binding repeat-containing protein n=1 Tax=Desulfitobacterium sp. AusDCA TaxID=3240383 RepID=UPI003DA6F44F